MRASAFVWVLSLVLLSTAAISGEPTRGNSQAQISHGTVSSMKGPRAEVPGVINFQGTLTDAGGVALDTTLSMTLAIYTDSTGGTQVWTETQPAVAVSSGLFNVLLGSFNAIPDSVFQDPGRWLSIQVGGDPELMSRQRIAAVGYAFWAAESDTAQFARNALGGSDGDWTISGDDMYSAVSGNVGIGTITPAAKLEVISSEVYNVYGEHQPSGNYGYLGSGTYAVRGRVESSNGRGVYGESANSTSVGVYGEGGYANYGYLGSENYGIYGKHYSSGNYGYIGGENHAVFGLHGAGGNQGHVGGDSCAIYGSSPSGYAGYFDGTSCFDGNVGIGTLAPMAKLHLYGILAVGEDSSGYDVNFYGANSGGRLFWDEDKMAFRAGRDHDGTHWVPDSVGLYSVAMGTGSKAKGFASTALGSGTTAAESYSVAMGYNSTASGNAATAIGYHAEANKSYATALGYFTTASGFQSTALGDNTVASGTDATAMGRITHASGQNSTAMGFNTGASGNASTTMGWGSLANGTASLAAGYFSTADGNHSTAIGWESEAWGDQCVTIGRWVNAETDSCMVIGSGIDNSNRLANYTPNSLIMGFKTTIPTLFVGGTNHRVGIGTSNPGAKLHVEGTIEVDQKIQANDSGGLELATDEGTTRLFISDAGKVGIGLTTPNKSLYVAENVNGLSYPLKIDNYNGNWNVAVGLLFSAGGDGTPSGHLTTARGKGALAYEYTNTWNRGKFHILQNTATDDSNPDLSDAVVTITNDGKVGIGTTSPATKLDVRGTLNVGQDSSGHDVNFYGADNGGKFFWDEDKMALRAGIDPSGLYWAPDSVGLYSVATGGMTKALGKGSAAIGWISTARGDYSFAAGYGAIADGNGSIAVGGVCDALGGYSAAMGYNASTTGSYAIAMGHHTNADGHTSVALGQYVNAGPADHTIVLGKGVDDSNYLVNNTENSLMVGFDTTSPTLFVGGTNHRVGVGTTSPNRKFRVVGDAGGSTTWYNDSDERLKKNIGTIENALGKVNKLRGVTFEWKDTQNHPEGQQMGMIAQEVKELVPEVVEKKGEYYSMATANLVPVLVEAVKEQQKIIERLETRIEVLESVGR